ncbi:hypothetical protein [Desulforhabdus sp. TSK]|uniref:hypothetical protein n=1 Tax=Desulforhabdus sp. TSK TaxID=2925014 RepID=UPI001FC8156A|nr:hypothetical protein [Desulforhabdus sp. TSK]GKT08378.1 hypothetical protein DSTSK_16830 [Desulforhabdus sp. TSK]
MKTLEIHAILGSDNLLGYPQSPRGMWVDEAIWGHRIRSTSSIGNFQFLEFLSVVESLFRQDPAALFSHGSDGKALTYEPRRSILLRNLIFNNVALNRMESRSLPDEEKWSEWVEGFRASFQPVDRFPDFAYLRPRFVGFDNFKEHIRLLQRLSLDPNTSIRWTSRFIFPIGMDAMFTDLGKDLTREAVNFMRNGEIIYLMLSRSSVAAELRSGFTKLLEASKEKNKLLEKLLPDDERNNPDIAKAGAGNMPAFLPYLSHPAYDRFAEDVLALLALDLPDQDCFQFLIPLFSFHLVLFYLETARACTGKEGLGAIVCEIVAPRPDQVRQASLESFAGNDSEGIVAVEELLTEFFGREEIIQITEASISPIDKVKEMAQLFNKAPTKSWRFCWNIDEHSTPGNCPEEFFREFLNDAKLEFKNKSGEIHRGLGKECGLVSRRGTRSLRYAPTDDFLRMLVVTRVRGRVELSEFLVELFARYRLVIGHKEALRSPEIQDSHKSENPFRKNTDRLIRRMESMGLARRMSDGCTYVENPFFEAER